MVIQRSWKILSDAASTAHNATTSESQQRSPAVLQANNNSSSDDSDCSNQTTHSMDTRVASPAKQLETEKPAETNILDNSKFVTNTEMAETMLQRIKQRYSGAHNLESGGSAESAMRALELLRISVQQSFDSEINAIIKRYMTNYFKPAFGNIKENLGQHAINEEALQKMSSCALLENAKAQYTNFVLRQQRPTASVAMNTTITEQQRLGLKRQAKASDFVPNKQYANNFAYAMGKSIAQLPNEQQQQQQLPLAQQQQQQQLQRPPLSGMLPTPVRRQIFWNTAQITTSTKFVLDVQANLAFGFSIDGKEMGGARLASKHPEIIRYLPDAEDREWLSNRGIIPADSRSSRFLFLIYDEVCRLQQTHELYRNQTNIDLSMMLTFSVTETMIQKMKLFFVDLNIKSRGLITNSFIVATNQQQLHQQQQPPPPPPLLQQQQLPSSNNSHLRNALLQGAPVQQSTSTPNSTAVVATTDETVNVPKELPPPAASPCLQGTVVGSSTTTPQVINKLIVGNSTLSSSHATLTALLNQSGTPAAPSATNAKFRN
ncbi:CG42304 [Drosophila busckii]|uniref:CG42304 n=1 Tax=Drosophila busckii TaxID=30019 RepID=A0A0M4EYP0_DROBS|nr:uncharacterized protein LOC108600276 [Drosophila busckii]ALC43357.1 CG42304 [Drosophila busckii]